MAQCFRFKHIKIECCISFMSFSYTHKTKEANFKAINNLNLCQNLGTSNTKLWTLLRFQLRF